MTNALTLFSGMGGSSLALRRNGLDVLAHEIDPDACDTLRANGFKVHEGDVREVDFTQHRGRIRVVMGGPPCQPFSQAHDGEGQYDPRDMIPEFIRCVAECLPEVFIMEEVQTLTWKKHIDYLTMVEGHLAALGYNVEHRVLNAADYEIPQARKRLIVVGVRVDTGRPVSWPLKSDRVVTMAEALGWDHATCMARNLIVPDSRARVAGTPLSWKATWPLDRPGMTVVGSFRPEVMAAPGYRKAGDPPRQGTPGSVVVTQTERLRLQDFPTDWVVCGKTDSQDLQIGNSVPVGMAERIIYANLS